MATHYHHYYRTAAVIHRSHTARMRQLDGVLVVCVVLKGKHLGMKDDVVNLF